MPIPFSFVNLTVIVVTHNSESTIQQCLDSIPLDCEVIVVDNASLDRTRQIVSATPDIKLICYEKNMGFGAACNQGILEANSETILLLNPDAWSIDNGIKNLYDFLQTTPNCVAAGGKLEFPNGSLQESACSELTLSKLFLEQTYLEKLFGSPYWISGKITKPDKVEQVMGACLMMKKVSERFLNFNPEFFLYCEDTELCKRLRQFGEIWYVPTARFGHHLGTSSLESRWKAVQYYNRGKEVYFRIHKGRFASFICFLTNRLGSVLRILPGLLTLGLVPNLRSKSAMFLRVLFGKINPYPEP